MAQKLRDLTIKTVTPKIAIMMRTSSYNSQKRMGRATLRIVNISSAPILNESFDINIFSFTLFSKEHRSIYGKLEEAYRSPYVVKLTINQWLGPNHYFDIEFVYKSELEKLDFDKFDGLATVDPKLFDQKYLDFMSYHHNSLYNANCSIL